MIFPEKPWALICWPPARTARALSAASSAGPLADFRVPLLLLSIISVCYQLSWQAIARITADVKRPDCHSVGRGSPGDLPKPNEDFAGVCGRSSFARYPVRVERVRVTRGRRVVCRAVGLADQDHRCGYLVGCVVLI